MSWETVRSSLDLLLMSERRDLQLYFIGGEPLLQMPLIRRAVAHCRRRARSSQRIRYEIITNGTLLDEAVASFLDRHGFKIHLSFDGVREAQDLRGRGTFRVLDRLLDRLRRRRPELYSRRLRVAMTATSANIPTLAASIEYFLQKGIREISVAPVYTHDPGWRLESIEDLGAQFSRILHACLRHHERSREVPLLPFRGKGVPAGRSDRGRTMCGAQRGETLAVDIDGHVHGCLTFGLSYEAVPSDFLSSRLEAMRMGDLRDPSFTERLALYPEAARSTGLFHAKQEKYSSYGRCGECRYMRTCDVCPTSIGHVAGNTDPNRVSDMLCAWSLVTHRYAEIFRRRTGMRDLLIGRAELPPLMRRLQSFVEARRSTGSGSRT